MVVLRHWVINGINLLYIQNNSDKFGPIEIDLLATPYDTGIIRHMSKCVVRDLEKSYGICVVDNFMGKERAESIHRP